MVFDFAEADKQAGRLALHGRIHESLMSRLDIERLCSDSSVSSSNRARNLSLAASLAHKIGDLSTAELLTRKCVAVYGAIRDIRCATYRMSLACILAEQRQFDEAISHAEAAILLFESLEKVDSSFVAYRKRDLERMREHVEGSYLDG
jgi:hypothetical protein